MFSCSLVGYCTYFFQMPGWRGSALVSQNWVGCSTSKVLILRGVCRHVHSIHPHSCNWRCCHQHAQGAIALEGLCVLFEAPYNMFHHFSSFFSNVAFQIDRCFLSLGVLWNWSRQTLFRFVSHLQTAQSALESSRQILIALQQEMPSDEEDGKDIAKYVAQKISEKCEQLKQEEAHHTDQANASRFRNLKDKLTESKLCSENGDKVMSLLSETVKVMCLQWFWPLYLALPGPLDSG